MRPYKLLVAALLPGSLAFHVAGPMNRDGCPLVVASRRRQQQQQPFPSVSSRWGPISSPGSKPLFTSSSNTPTVEEEILLCLNLHLANDDVDMDQAVAAVSKYCQSFPFAVILPVQPLQYLPLDDGGVEVKFLRKKTDEKSGIDGGIQFSMERTDDDRTMQVTARRNSSGQFIQKSMAEKLVVTNFVAGITGSKDLGNPPSGLVLVSSVFHKWM